MAAVSPTSHTPCSSVFHDLVFEGGHPPLAIDAQVQYYGHLWRCMGYVQRGYFTRLERSESAGGGRPIIRPQPDGEFNQMLISHKWATCPFMRDGDTDTPPDTTEEDRRTDHLSSQRPQTQGSHRSLWVSAAVVIGALFAIAMVARFGGGMGMSTSGANIFVGVTGAALGTYTFCALPVAIVIDRRERVGHRYVPTTSMVD